MITDDNLEHFKKLKNDLYGAVKSANTSVKTIVGSYSIKVFPLIMKTLAQSVLVHAFYLRDYKKELEKVFMFTTMRKDLSLNG